MAGLRLFAILVAALFGAPALGQPVPAAAAGNLPADFYVKSDCKKPDTMSLRKPVSTEREEVSLYNAAVRRYNKANRDFDTCINAYIAKAPHDIDWIMFMVNTVAADANGSNRPTPPTAPGNMPSGFYPPPACIKPDRKPDAAPNARDTKAMDAHNTEVRTFNVLATDFNTCIQNYVARARVDIERIEKTQGEAGLHGATAYSAAPASPTLQLASSSQAAESVTVTGTKSRHMIESFVASFVAPTHMTGKIARWESGICPVTVGQRPAAAQYVTQRLKDVAVTVEAPVNSREGCTPNIEIVFTTTPQELLDNVRQHDADYLGYAASSAEREKLAIVTRPIQAWYTTQTKDLRGTGSIDTGRSRGAGASMSNFSYVPCSGCRGGNPAPIELGDAKFASVSGNRISDGMRSVLYHVLIVVDPRKLPDYEIGALADYIALLALTQLNSLDTCQQLPSIVNILAPGCERRPNSITEDDLAYLRGLYKMSSQKSLVVQRNEIADRMSEMMAGR